MNYQVLLYYWYVEISDPDLLRQEQIDLGRKLGLKGRILVSKEGINGTVSGTIDQTETYMRVMKSDLRFKDIVFKVDSHHEHVFNKLKVKVRKELVNLSLSHDVDPKVVTGAYLSPVEFYKQMQEDVVILDARNDYEYDLGHFKGAIRPDVTVFRDLPQWIETHEDLLANKRILTYCTGGVRCVKLSGWLKEKGYDVGQLEGGIVSYGKDPLVKGTHWEGSCYVFDKRISVGINAVNPSVVGKDFFTGEPCERYINCANPFCHRQMLVREENEARFLGSCSNACRLHPQNEYVLKHGLTVEAVKAINVRINSSQNNV